MARPKLRSPGQPFLVQFLLGLYETAASLRLAVVVIGASAAVLAWATVVESRYGSDVSQFAIYRTWWFWGLNALLGINVLCAALIRFPWKRSQIGFLITHAGILVLLAGCLLSGLNGIDAQLPVFEDGTGHLAFQKTQHFELQIHGQSPGKPAAENAAPAQPGQESDAATIEIPFASGPFNWRDYRKKLFFPWRLSHRDRGLIYDADGIQLEVLDYYSDSKLAAGRPLKLRAKSRPTAEPTGQAAPAGQWTTIELAVQGPQNPHSPHRRMALGSREALPGGERIVFWVAASRAETEAFLDSRPNGPLGDRGQLVLHAAGRRFQLTVEELQQRSPFPLGDTGLDVELVRYDPEFSGVVLRTRQGAESAGRMLLLADVPELNQQDHEHGVFGSYWVDAGSREDGNEVQPGGGPLRDPRRPRIDILQGTDKKLYYRTWKSPQVGVIAPLLTDGTRVVAFQQSEAPVTLYVEEFLPHDKPGWTIEPVPFEKKDKAFKQRRARLRLTVDDNREEFWLEGLPAGPLAPPPTEDQRRGLWGKNRRVAITLPWDQVDVGFQVYLHKFERKLDPGTSQASYYASVVDFLDRDEQDKVLDENVLITLNEPVTFADPVGGHSYRIYQEAYRGPWKPGDPIFDELVGGTTPRDELFLSWLTVNYDPGRGLKYAGCLLICVGFTIVFYIKTYLFRRRTAGQGEGR